MHVPERVDAPRQWLVGGGALLALGSWAYKQTARSKRLAALQEAAGSLKHTQVRTVTRSRCGAESGNFSGLNSAATVPQRTR